MDSKTYTVTDLMERYGLTRQAVLQYLSKHLEKVNADGLHASKVKGDWQIDEKGLETIDKARGYNTNLALEAELRQKRREQELLEEISTLKTAMLTIKEKYQQNKEELYKQLLQERERAHQAELLQLQSRSQLEQLQQAKIAAEQAAATAQERATAAEAATTQERQRAEDLKEKAETATKAAAKEKADELAAAVEKQTEIQTKYNKVAEENFRLKTALQAERQKSWINKLLGR